METIVVVVGAVIVLVSVMIDTFHKASPKLVLGVPEETISLVVATVDDSVYDRLSMLALSTYSTILTMLLVLFVPANIVTVSVYKN